MIMFSKKTRSTADEYSLSPQELAFADLLSAGWDMNDAYMWALQTGETWTEAAVRRSARELAARTEVKRRIRDTCKGTTSSKSKGKDEPDDDVMKALSKENMLRDLYLARKKMTPGSKDWLETNKMIADITRMKQEEVKTEDNTVHFFLPLTCHKCSLYLASKKQK